MKITHRIPTAPYAYYEVEFDDGQMGTVEIAEYHKKLLAGWSKVQVSKQQEELDNLFAKEEAKGKK